MKIYLQVYLIPVDINKKYTCQYLYTCKYIIVPVGKICARQNSQPERFFQMHKSEWYPTSTILNIWAFIDFKGMIPLVYIHFLQLVKNIPAGTIMYISVYMY